MGISSKVANSTHSPLYLALQQALYPSTKKTVGGILVMSLAATGLSAQAQTLELSDLDGTNGFVINGVAEGNQSGVAVSGLGDINDDDIDDLIIGANGVNANSGASYVVFGSTQNYTTPLELSDLDGTNGFTIPGIDPNDGAGAAVSGLGDINDDGIDDFIIGASTANPNNIASGESYVIFGRSQNFPSSLDLTALDGSDGFVVNGIDLFDQSGVSVSGLGDVNDDGVDDLLIGAFFASPNGNSLSGESYVVFGRSAGTSFPATLELSDLDGSNGIMIHGIAVNDLSGGAVSGLGDINDDGIDDLLIGANGANNGSGHGASYIVFGRPNSDPFTSPLDLSTLDGTDGVVLNGIAADDLSGGAVSGLGDVNGDGIDDLLIGANGANSFTGESYVVFGRPNSSPFTSPIMLSSLDGSNGFVIQGIAEGDQAGIAVSGLSDFNNDGINDLLIGASSAGPNGDFSGESYVVFGRPTGSPFTSPLALSALDASTGLVIRGVNASDFSGNAVSNLGDVNGDGGNDLLIGAFTASPNGSGQSYVVFGAPATDSTPDTFTFTNFTDVALSTQQTSDAITVTGINLPATISVSNGTYEINNSGVFTEDPGIVENNDIVRVRHISAAAFDTPTDTTLTIGGVSDTFTSTTIAADTPLDFTFIDVSNVPLLSEQTSNAIIVSGISGTTNISVTGGFYSINGAAFTSAPGMVNDGQNVRVQHIAAASFSTPVDTELTIGGVSDIFTSTTLAEDTVPEVFTFVDISNVALASLQTSNEITVAGINSPADISVNGGSYSIDGGTFTLLPGMVENGQTVRVRHTSAAILNTSTATTLTIGGVMDTFTSTTVIGDLIFEDQFED